MQLKPPPQLRQALIKPHRVLRNTAAINDEVKARADADSAMAQQIQQVTANYQQEISNSKARSRQSQSPVPMRCKPSAARLIRCLLLQVARIKRSSSHCPRVSDGHR